MTAVLNPEAGLLKTLKSANRPISVCMPDAAISAVKGFTDVLSELGIDGKVHVAHKATASRAAISALKNHASIDVASEHELDNAVHAGYSGADIIATGPKSNTFLARLAELPDVTIVIDSLSELERLQTALNDNGTKVKVLLRITRTLLNIPSIEKRSRFGLDRLNLQNALKLIRSSDHISLKGLAFHLDSESISERQYAAQQALELLLTVQQDFPTASVLDIGGGYGTDYGVSRSDVLAYEADIKNVLLSTAEPFTWQGRSFGFSSDGARIRGELTGVDKSHDSVAAERLRSILEHKDSSGTSLARQIEESLIELWVEPGSSIFSAAGLIAAEIIDIHQRDGENFIVVDAHRNQICFEGNEHVADPILLSGDDSVEADPYEAYIVGHLCMESDFMMYRKIALPRPPRIGDSLVWLHTGAYRSHFSASRAIGQPDVARYVFDGGSLVEESA